MINMEDDIISFLKEYDLTYVKIDNIKSIEKIHNLFINGDTNENPETDIEYLYYGNYYRYKIKDYDSMKKYFLMAIELNNVFAMQNLADFYQDEKDYDSMKKYYLMAIELKYLIAMVNLAYFYQYIEKDYDSMKKYYLMAIELTEPIAMNNLGR